MVSTGPLVRLLSVFILAFVIATAALPLPLAAQQSAATKPAPGAATDYSAQLAVIEKASDDKRPV